MSSFDDRTLRGARNRRVDDVLSDIGRRSDSGELAACQRRVALEPDSRLVDPSPPMVEVPPCLTAVADRVGASSE